MCGGGALNFDLIRKTLFLFSPVVVVVVVVSPWPSLSDWGSLFSFSFLFSFSVFGRLQWWWLSNCFVFMLILGMEFV